MSFSLLKAALAGCLVVSSVAAQADTGDLEVFDDYIIGVWQWLNPANVQISYNVVQSGSASMEFQLAGGATSGFNYSWGWFPAKDLTKLEFWCRLAGNTTQNQVGIQVGFLSGASPVVRASNYATLTSGAWTRVQIPVSALGATPSSLITWINVLNMSSSAADFYVDGLRIVGPQPLPFTSVVVDASNPLRALTPQMFGIGTFCWDPFVNFSDTIDRLVEGGVSTMTFPGGSTADSYDWRTNRSRPDGVLASTDTRGFLRAAKKVGAQKIFSVNYGSGTPQEAADWVRYANITLNGNALHWSIGNEVYGFWEYDTHAFQHDALTYAAFVRDCFTLMKAVDPRIKIGINGTINPTEWPQRVSVVNPVTGETQNGWSAVLLSKLREYGITPDYYDFHFYPSSPHRESDSFLLQTTSLLEAGIVRIRETLNDYLGEQGKKVKIFVSETNAVSYLPGKQSTSLVSALFLADLWGTACNARAAGFVWWNLHDTATDTGNFSTTLYGWRNVGTYGVLSRGLPEGLAPPLNSPYPSFYACKLLKVFARAGDQMVPITSSNKLLSVYAATSPDSSRLRLMVINKSREQDILTGILLKGFRSKRNVTVWRYGIDNDASQTDVSTSILTTTPFQSVIRTLTFPRYSITILEF